MGDRLGGLRDQSCGRPGIVDVAGHERHQAAAGHEFHAEVVLAVVRADLVDRDDARVVEQGDGLGLVPEPAQLVVAGEQAGPDHLEGDGSIERDLAGLVDDAHAAAADFAADLVVAEVAHAACQCARVSVSPSLPAPIVGPGVSAFGRSMVGPVFVGPIAAAASGSCRGRRRVAQRSSCRRGRGRHRPAHGPPAAPRRGSRKAASPPQARSR